MRLSSMNLGQSGARSSATTSLVIFCALSILSSSSPSLAVDEIADSSSSGASALQSSGVREPDDYSPLLSALYQLPAASKRAYTFRYETKRLPTFDFGIGKRSYQDSVAKRVQRYREALKRAKSYSFGVGKRSTYDDNTDENLLCFKLMPNDMHDGYAHLRQALDNLLQKRGTAFKFGIGKRDAEKRDDDDLQENMPIKHLSDKYLFGLGKRGLDREPAYDAEEIA